jgi:uncharacterized protein
MARPAPPAVRASSPASRLYFGTVTHRRFRPVGNVFRYRIFFAYLDLAELPGLFDGRWFWSARRPALAWFRRGDYLGDPAVPLNTCVRDRVLQALGFRPDGPVRLLTHLRYFGHHFSPVSFYYCHDAGGRLVAIVAEITNTPWKERHSYVLDTRDGGHDGAPWRFEFDKAFHVSPFMPMRQRYRWRFSLPGDRLAVYMENLEDGVPLFDAGLDLRERPLDGRSLAAALLRFPVATVAIVAQIHWQALRLLLKRTPFHEHPPATDQGA